MMILSNTSRDSEDSLGSVYLPQTHIDLLTRCKTHHVDATVCSPCQDHHQHNRNKNVHAAVEPQLPKMQSSLLDTRFPRPRKLPRIGRPWAHAPLLPPFVRSRYDAMAGYGSVFKSVVHNGASISTVVCFGGRAFDSR